MSDTESDHDYDTREDVPSEDNKLIESSNHPPSLDDILRLLEVDDDAFDRISECMRAYLLSPRWSLNLCSVNGCCWLFGSHSQEPRSWVETTSYIRISTPRCAMIQCQVTPTS